LTAWAKTLKLPSDKVCFFNFTASHDGIGVRAVSNILDKDELNFMVNSCKAHGGLVSYRSVGGEEKSPYELNCSYIDILTSPDEDDALRLKRMILSQAVVLAMPGVPGIYFHSLVGSRNYHEAVRKTRRNRAINREKLNFDNIKEELSEEGSLRNNLFKRYKQLISIRIHEPCFDPFAKFEFLSLGKEVFAIKRYSKESNEFLIALHNFQKTEIEVDISPYKEDIFMDIISHRQIKEGIFIMQPYEVLWLKKLKQGENKND